MGDTKFSLLLFARLRSVWVGIGVGLSSVVIVICICYGLSSVGIGVGLGSIVVGRGRGQFLSGVSGARLEQFSIFLWQASTSGLSLVDVPSRFAANGYSSTVELSLSS